MGKSVPLKLDQFLEFRPLQFTVPGLESRFVNFTGIYWQGQIMILLVTLPLVNAPCVPVGYRCNLALLDFVLRYFYWIKSREETTEETFRKSLSGKLNPFQAWEIFLVKFKRRTQTTNLWKRSKVFTYQVQFITEI